MVVVYPVVTEWLKVRADEQHQMTVIEAYIEADGFEASYTINIPWQLIDKSRFPDGLFHLAAENSAGKCWLSIAQQAGVR